MNYDEILRLRQMGMLALCDLYASHIFADAPEVTDWHRLEVLTEMTRTQEAVLKRLKKSIPLHQMMQLLPSGLPTKAEAVLIGVYFGRYDGDLSGICDMDLQEVVRVLTASRGVA